MILKCLDECLQHRLYNNLSYFLQVAVKHSYKTSLIVVSYWKRAVCYILLNNIDRGIPTFLAGTANTSENNIPVPLKNNIYSLVPTKS